MKKLFVKIRVEDFHSGLYTVEEGKAIKIKQNSIGYIDSYFQNQHGKVVAIVNLLDLNILVECSLWHLNTIGYYDIDILCDFDDILDAKNYYSHPDNDKC